MTALSIVIPVYNEGANFRELWNQVGRDIKADFTACVIYDFDEDDMLPIVHELMKGGELRLRP
jgi:hypothetical protein